MKKFLVLALSLCMVLALCVCGYAEEGNHDLNPAVDHSEDCLVAEGFDYISVAGCSAYECGKEAYIHFHCTICGDVVDTITLDVEDEHDYQTVEGCDATCEGDENPKTGLTEGSQCARECWGTWECDGKVVEWHVACGDWEKEQEVIPVKPCEAAQWYGWEEYYTNYIQEHGFFCDEVDSLPAFCMYCQNMMEGSITIELEHEWVEGAAREPDCWNEGNAAYEACEVCGALKFEDKIYYTHWEWTEEFYKAVRIKELGHDWVAVNGSLGSCWEDAVSDHMACTRCGLTDGMTVIPATGHEWGETVAANPSTCTEDGWYEYQPCVNDRCEETKAIERNENGDIIGWWTTWGIPVDPADGHDLKMKPGVAHTCTTDGNAAYQYCSKCPVIIYNGSEYANKDEALVVIPAHGHVNEDGYWPMKWNAPMDSNLYPREDKYDGWDLVEIWQFWEGDSVLPKADWKAYWELKEEERPYSYAATCEEDGYQMALYCPWCGVKMVEAHTIPATGHDYEITMRGIEPTCDNEGWSDEETCKNCGDVKGWNVINARGHILETVAGSMPTCEKDGAYDWSYCTREGCDHAEFFYVELILRQGDVATGFGVDYIDTTYSVDEKTKKVSINADVVIPAFEHGLAWPYVNEDGTSPCIAPIAYVEPTCVITGLAGDGEYCTLCNEWTKAPTVLDMIPHNWDRYDEGWDATCIHDGQYNIVWCGRCGVGYALSWDEDGNEIWTPNFKWDTEKNPWELELPKSAVIPAKGHVEAPSKYVAPTCTEVGYEADGTWCKVCGVTVKAATEIPALGHDDLVLEYKAPTCTETGLTEGAWCKRCGLVDAKGNPIDPYKPQEEIPALGHEFGRVEPYRAPGCTMDGNKAGLGCSNEGCDEYLIYPTVIPATNHCSYDKETDTYGASYLRLVPAQQPLCDMEGWYDIVYCSNPKCDYVAGADNDLLDGGMMFLQTVPFDEKGNVVTEKHYYYENGEQKYIETPVIPEDMKIAAPGHDFNTYVDRKPTCTEDGILTAKTCKTPGCGYNEPGEYRPALGHEPVSGAKAPTCTENGWGEDRVICSRYDECGYVYTEGTWLEPLGHNEVHVEAIAPKCEEVGYTEGVRCTNEGCDYVIGCEEVPATGHSKGEWVVERQPQLPQNDPVYGGYGLEVLYCANAGCGEPLDQRTIEPLKKGTMGDANGDGAVNAVDALAILLYDARLLPASRIDLALADMNGDGVVNSIDSLMVLKASV